jgi:endonuclease YncB( thermonuclease family)
MRLPWLIFLATIPFCARAAEITGRVVGVSDGDTITLLDASRQQHKIRLSGIDAPEKAQPYGQRSKEHLSRLIFNRQVSAECGKTDKYRRQVCKVSLDGADINLEQIGAGMGWWYRQYAREQAEADRTTYEKAEQDAQQARRGLWRDHDPIAPWEWRHRQKTKP